MDNYGNDLLTSAFIHSILIILDENLPPNNTSSNIVKETVRFAKIKEINNEYNIANTFSYIKIVRERSEANNIIKNAIEDYNSKVPTVFQHENYYTDD